MSLDWIALLRVVAFHLRFVAAAPASAWKLCKPLWRLIHVDGHGYDNGRVLHLPNLTKKRGSCVQPLALVTSRKFLHLWLLTLKDWSLYSVRANPYTAVLPLCPHLHFYAPSKLMKQYLTSDICQVVALILIRSIYLHYQKIMAIWWFVLVFLA